MIQPKHIENTTSKRILFLILHFGMGGTILILYAHNITLKRRKESDKAHCQNHFLGLDEAP